MDEPLVFFCRRFFLQVVFDRLKGMALVLYNEIEYAQAAVKETKGRKIGGNKIKVCRMTSNRSKTKSCSDPSLLVIGILLVYRTCSIYGLSF